MSDAPILVAMSGGVDSAAVAILLSQQGHACVGATLRLVPEHPGTSLFEPCCGLEAAQDAARVCTRLGIKHHIHHAVERFDREIIEPFIAEYERGRTPNPCIACNQRIKFGDLYDVADRFGASHIAMGHYARLEEREGRWALRRASYRPKDQSYVLAPLTQAQLSRALFPLGDKTKDEARALARPIDYVSSAKAESQEICFVHDRNYAGFIEARRGFATPGPMRDRQGRSLGRHRGLIHYTIGQRRGLNLGGGPEPHYVLRLDVENNTLIVGPRSETLCQRFTVGPLCWGALPPQDGAFTGTVQLHSRHRAIPATLHPTAEGGRVELPTPQSAVTPGQWAVFYHDDYVAAAAIVESFENV
jgi:tRNA-uridine 2-sulfurtransferase